ncbi:Transcription initiation factor TFIID subunit 12 [Entophlyctis sp. JEL0112]|nr:Transcription initiation factor TFIID subunit 12 [Entophlyctis sp. JEL0112]
MQRLTRSMSADADADDVDVEGDDVEIADGDGDGDVNMDDEGSDNSTVNDDDDDIDDGETPGAAHGSSSSSNGNVIINSGKSQMQADDDDDVEDEDEDKGRNLEDVDESNSVTGAGDEGNAPGGSAMPATSAAAKHDREREKGLLDLLAMMEESAPLIPDSVADHFLAKAGFECSDVRVKRLLALATQKFIADIAQDAFHYSKIRQQSTTKDKKASVKKTVLTVEDLSGALAEHGINIKKPEYFL